jgi:hypothetical protein
LGAFDADPPVVPKVNVLVVDIALLNPPVPIQVKLVAFAILRFTWAAVGVVKLIKPVPNDIERVLVLVELNVPVDKLQTPNSNVPDVSVVAPVTVSVSAPALTTEVLGDPVVVKSGYISK